MNSINGKPCRPIAFVDELVRAIKNDLKTETRRIVKGVPYWDHSGRPIMEWPLSGCQIGDDGKAWIDVQTAVDDSSRISSSCPYGKAGEFLWVRERFVALKYDLTVCKIGEADGVAFRDGATKWKNGKTRSIGDLPGRWNGRTWRPPMHLPFWGFRIGLEVTSIGIERVQDITEAGAVAEGFHVMTLRNEAISALFQFRSKWDVINGKRSDRIGGKPFTWETNPFVWVVKFRKICDPIQVG